MIRQTLQALVETLTPNVQACDTSAASASDQASSDTATSAGHQASGDTAPSQSKVRLTELA